ncbi:DUF2252 domain-containing protein [Acetobacter sp. DsW_063]|uniref:DUF2252 domain-containing protein n=1 Tax=Acetobacter sp. DsW_063 TaxID=1514894 RepID=UPI001E5D006C|nr:DUF2252 domain-containing protein [Acetobacter sp. DsW_063]
MTFMSFLATGEAAASALTTRKERHAVGRRLRENAKRSSQAEWNPALRRADPIALLIAQGERRIASLLPIRYERMAASPLAFLRGAAAVMATDLSATTAAGLRVQSCGDCHLANFGSFASSDGIPVFDINDFDETSVAPFEWDIKRLGTSLVLAGRENDLGDGPCRALVVSAADAYQSELQRLNRMTPLQAWSEKVDLLATIDAIEKKSVRERVRGILQARLESASGNFGLVSTERKGPSLREKPPLIVRLPDHDDAIRAAFGRYLAAQPAERAVLLGRYRLKDVIFKVVGVGSVGTFCAIGLFANADGETLLLQIKEAQDSVLAPYAGRSGYANAGERVVTGQRVMQVTPDRFLGWTHTDDAGKGEAVGRQFYVRRVKDARLAQIGTVMQQDELPFYAALCGRTLARAHVRSADVAMLTGYIGKGGVFADAIAGFSVAYADQSEADWRAFKDALKGGRLVAG